MPALHSIFLSLALSHLLVLGVYILIYHRHSALGLLSAFLVFTLLCGLAGEGLNYIVNADDPTWQIYVTMALNRIGNLSMLLTWLLALKLFDDNFSLRSVHPAIWAFIGTALVARSIGSYYANYGVELSKTANFLTWGYSQAVLFGFSLASMYIAIKGFRSDLVIERRQERVIFVICVTILLLLMAGNRGVWVLESLVRGTLLTPVPLNPVWYSIYAYLATVALFLWKFRVANLSVGKSAAKAVNDQATRDQQAREMALSTRIRDVMEQQKLYHEPSLTVAGLAEQVDSQEYLVRRAINNHMGYRNFSDFLNHYRIGETSRLLAETSEPISNIGFDVGYTSLSSFYKAFKEKHAVTPKQYRAQHSVKA